MNNESYKAVVLAVADDPAVIADLTRILSTGGYACHCCRDLAGAIKRFRSAAPDLIIADLGLVGPNGYRLTEAIRREVGYFDVPLMYLSSVQQPDIIHRQSDTGGAYYLRKPLEVVVLLELVDKALWRPHAVGMR